MEYTSVKNPVWADSENTYIKCQVLFAGQQNFFPFTASVGDPESHGVRIFNECVAGRWGAIRAYTAPPVPEPTAEQNKTTAIRRLADTDWAMTNDIANPEVSNPYLTNQAEFGEYRNTVRQFVINPVAGILTWPAVPTAQWSS